jgi:hypothetical protein
MQSGAEETALRRHVRAGWRFEQLCYVSKRHLYREENVQNSRIN